MKLARSVVTLQTVEFRSPGKVPISKFLFRQPETESIQQKGKLVVCHLYLGRTVNHTVLVLELDPLSRGGK